MPNKYSHALVLSHYEARGFTDLHNYPRRPKPAASSVSADKPHSQRRPNPPPATRAQPIPHSRPIKPTPTKADAHQPSGVSRPVPPSTSAPPRAVFEDSPPSTPELPHSNIHYRHAPPSSRSSRRSSLDQKPAPPTKPPPTSSRGYKHVPSDTQVPPHSHSEYPPASTAAAQPSPALKEIPWDNKVLSRMSIGAADILQTTPVPSRPLPQPDLKEKPRNTQFPPPLCLDSNSARSTTTSSSIPRPRTADATPAATSPPPLFRPRTFTSTASFESSRSSHYTTDSVLTQIYAPESIAPPPTPPRSSASFETAILAPPLPLSPKLLPHHKPPAIPPRSSSIPRPTSSSIHQPDFDTFSSANSPTMSSPNSTFTSTSSFHQTPRTSYSHVTSSLPSKSPELEHEFNLDQAPAPDMKAVPFSEDLTIPWTMPWEDLDELSTFSRPSISSDPYNLETPSTRRSSFDEAAPPPITRLPRTQVVPPSATKKSRRLSFNAFRPDCEAISYDQTPPGPPPVPIATAKDPKIKEKNSAVQVRNSAAIERDYAKRTSKRTGWGLMRRISAVKDPFEDKTRGRGFSRAATGFV